MPYVSYLAALSVSTEGSRRHPPGRGSAEECYSIREIHRGGRGCVKKILDRLHYVAKLFQELDTFCAVSHS